MKKVLSLVLTICCIAACCVTGFSASAASAVDVTNKIDVFYSAAINAVKYYDYSEGDSLVVDIISDYLDFSENNYDRFVDYRLDGDMEGYNYSVPADVFEAEVVNLVGEMDDVLLNDLHSDYRYNEDTETYDFFRGGKYTEDDYCFIGYTEKDGDYIAYVSRSDASREIEDITGLVEGIDYIFGGWNVETGDPHFIGVKSFCSVTFEYDDYDLKLVGVANIENAPTEYISYFQYNVGLTEITEDADASGEGWTWDADTKTLTLDGINFESKLCYDNITANASDEEKSMALMNMMGNMFICTPPESTIVINGLNTIKADTVGSVMNDAFYCLGKTTFTGKGTLNAEGALIVGDVYSDAGMTLTHTGHLIFDGPTVNLVCGGDFDSGVYATKFEMKKGTLSATAPMNGLATTDFAMTGGVLTLKATQPDEDAEMMTGCYASALRFDPFYPAEGDPIPPAINYDGIDVFCNTGTAYDGAVKLGEAQLELYNEDVDKTLLTNDGKVVTDVRFTAPMKAVEEKTEDLTVSAEAGVFPADVVIKVETIEKGEIFTRVETALKNVAEKFAAFEITAESGGVAVQPDGKVKITFNIPSDFDADRLAVYYIAPDGKSTELESTVDATAKTVAIEVDHFSTYVLALKAESAPSEGGSAPAPSKPIPSTGDAGSIAFFMVAASAAAAFVFRKKR